MSANTPTSHRSTDAMTAVVRHEYGSSEHLRQDVMPRPVPGRGEVLVAVHAAGLDRGTWHVMTGTPYAARLAFGLTRPRTPGLGIDLAGTVVGVGDGVTRFLEGDEVFGFGSAALAEFAVARESRLALKPVGLSFSEAAVLPVSGVTAANACDLGKVGDGIRVLVVGASGGVGSYAVQLAAARGATVTGVCSGPKADFVRSLGAQHVIDYRTADPFDGRIRYDVVLAIGGNASLSRLRRALTPTGTLVVVGGEDTGRWVGMGRQFGALVRSAFTRQTLTMLMPRERASDLEQLAEFVAAGSLRPRVDATYPLADTADAMRRIEAGSVSGKIAVVLTDR